MRKIGFGLLAVVALGLSIQWVPYAKEHENPRVDREPEWDRPETREAFLRVCGNCHSNETRWPWYSSVAPFSWLVRHDVDEARSHFNVSEWGREKNHGDEAAKMVREGEMPPWFYLPAHPEAWISDADREKLVAGLVSTFGDEEDEGSEHEGHGSH